MVRSGGRYLNRFPYNNIFVIPIDLYIDKYFTLLSCFK